MASGAINDVRPMPGAAIKLGADLVAVGAP
jgi:hypothetical protein